MTTMWDSWVQSQVQSSAVLDVNFYYRTKRYRQFYDDKQIFKSIIENKIFHLKG